MNALKKLTGCHAVVACCALAIAAISVHDAALIVLNDEVIVECEQNPMGRWLLDIADGHVLPFVIVKLVGTTTVCTLILAMLRYWPCKAVTISTAVACFQFGLLTYLSAF